MKLLDNFTNELTEIGRSLSDDLEFSIELVAKISSLPNLINFDICKQLEEEYKSLSIAHRLISEDAFKISQLYHYLSVVANGGQP